MLLSLLLRAPIPVLSLHWERGGGEEEGREGGGKERGEEGERGGDGVLFSLPVRAPISVLSLPGDRGEGREGGGSRERGGDGTNPSPIFTWREGERGRRGKRDGREREEGRGERPRRGRGEARRGEVGREREERGGVLPSPPPTIRALIPGCGRLTPTPSFMETLMA